MTDFMYLKEAAVEGRNDPSEMHRARGIWVNVAHIIFVEDYHSGADVLIRLADGSEIHVEGDDGDKVQWWCRRHSLLVEAEINAESQP